MRHLRRILTALVAVLCGLLAKAQTDPSFTHYFDIPTYFNPAAVGQIDYIRIRGAARLQWVGVDNAPTSFVLTGDMPFKFIGKRFGTGINLFTESAGLYKTITAGAQIGYKFKALKGEWTIGLEPGIINQAFKGSKVYIPEDDDYHQATDEAIPNTDVAGTSFDLGVGLWYNHPRFYAGVSMKHALSPSVKFSDSDNQTGGVTGGESADGTNIKEFSFDARRTLYFTAGCNIPIKNTLWEVMPSMIYRSDFTFWNVEATARVRYNKFLIAGIGYRYDDAVSALLGVEIKGFYLGYSFDYSLSEIGRASSGSHEIVAGYNLKLNLGEKNRHRHKSVRLM